MSEPIDLSLYFTPEQLCDLAKLERTRLENLVRNYHQLLKLGIPAKKPDFMKHASNHLEAESQRRRQPFRPPDTVRKPLPKRNEGTARRSGRDRKEVVRYSAETSTKSSFELLADVDLEFSDDGDPDFDPRDLDWTDEETNEREALVDLPSTSKRRKVTTQRTNVKMIVTQKKVLPKRKCVGAIKSYKEDEMLYDDSYIFCFDCNKEFLDGCSEHILLPLMDTQVQLGTENRAEKTLPNGFSLSSSKIKGAGRGVWCDVPVMKNTLFGPYEGVTKPCMDVTTDDVSGYGWLVKQSEDKSMYIDGEDMKVSNWLRFINCSRNKAEQNCDAFQYRGKIYYVAFKDIHEGHELLVWYGDDYASDLGIDKLKYNQPRVKPKPETVDTEVESSAEPKLHYCLICRCPFVNLYSMRKHEARAHSDEDSEKNIHYLQDPSLVTISTSRKPRQTAGRSDAGKRYKCEGCEYHTDNKSNLQTHIRTHTGEKPFKCELCEYRTAQSGDLQRHIRTHTGEKPFKCELCEYRTTQPGALQTHIRTHTGEKPFKCELCEYRTTQSGDLQKHIRTHTGEKPFKCELCEYRTTQSGDLQKHIRTHTGEKPFKCELCEYRTTQPINLQAHIRTHTGEKPFKCELCEYRATQPSNLQAHIRTHTGEKPFKCELCEYRTTHSGNLQKHIRTHTGEKPFKCEL